MRHSAIPEADASSSGLLGPEFIYTRGPVPRPDRAFLWAVDPGIPRGAGARLEPAFDLVGRPTDRALADPDQATGTFRPAFFDRSRSARGQ